MIITKDMLNKINELQNETIQKAEKISGSDEYIKKQIELFHEAEKYRKSLSSQITKEEIEVSMQFAKIAEKDAQFLKMSSSLQKEIKIFKSIIKKQEELTSGFLN